MYQACLTVLTILPLFEHTAGTRSIFCYKIRRGREEAQIGPAEYLATSAIMLNGHYSFEAHCSLLGLRRASWGCQCILGMMKKIMLSILDYTEEALVVKMIWGHNTAYCYVVPPNKSRLLSGVKKSFWYKRHKKFDEYGNCLGFHLTRILRSDKIHQNS